LKSRRLVIAALAAGMLAAAVGCTEKAPEKIRIAMVVKSLGNGFFDAAHTGANEAAAQLKNVEIIYTGPTTPSAEGQIDHQLFDQPEG